MKILYHHRTASSDGQSTHIEEMVHALRKLGHEVTIAAPGVDDRNKSGGSPGWVGWLKDALPRFAYEFLELAYSAVAYRRLSKVIRDFKPDVIYERYNLFLLAGVWARTRFGLPLALEVNAPVAQERRTYGKLALGRLADWAEQYVWRRADFVFPVTQVLADYIAAQGVSPKRIVVVHNAINEDQYVALPRAEQAKARLGLTGRLVIGFIGFAREWDRLDRIVQWLAAYRGREIPHLLIIGDGPARREIEECAAKLGASERVTFTGVLPREQVPAAAAAFDIAIQTMLVPYTSPLSLFEYLALGKAIVAPNQPNYREILQDRINALLYDPCDAKALEGALNELCTNVELRRRIAGMAGTVIRERHFTWLANAEKVAGAMGSTMHVGIQDTL